MFFHIFQPPVYKKPAFAADHGQPGIKQQAEELPDNFGVPLSVPIGSRCRQIIMASSVPLFLQRPHVPEQGYSEKQSDTMMEAAES